MSRTAIYVAAAAVAVAGLYVWRQRKPGESLAGAAGRSAATFVFDGAAGAVKGIGAAVGIPDTDNAKCEADLARGDMWAASFSCPAKRFVGGAYTRTFIDSAAIEDARQIDRIIERQQAGRADLGVVTDPATGYPAEAYDALGNRIY